MTNTVTTLLVQDPIKRTGTLRSMDATRTVHTTTLVRELDDGSIEYQVGASARRRDGWASVPANVQPEIRWDEV